MFLGSSEWELCQVQVVRKVGRTVEQTLTSAATLGCLQRRDEKPRLHIEATFYRVGAEEVKAVSRGDSSQQVTQRLAISCPPCMLVSWYSSPRFCM